MSDQLNSKSAPKRRLAVLLRRVASGARDEGGAVAVFFAVALVLLTPLILGTFDIAIANRQRGQLQDALDSATLYAAKSSAQTDTDINTVGTKALAANMKLVPGATLVSSSFTLSNGKVVGNAAIQPPALAPSFWAPQPVTAHSEVLRSMDKLEIALVLDNTGSMQGTKLATLKSAGKDLVDKLAAAASRSTDPTPIRIALVPFAQTVRVQGTTALTSYNNTTHTGPGIPAWIDPFAKSHWNGTTNLDTLENASSPSSYVDRFTMMKAITVGGVSVPWNGCVEVRAQPYDVQDTVPVSTTPDTMYVPYFWPDEPDSGYYNNNYMDDPFGSGLTWLQKERRSSKYSGSQDRTNNGVGPNKGCALQQVLRLTTNMASIKSGIDAMVATGETNIPIGMAWGWNALAPNGPYSDGLAYGTEHLKKIVILMTDGENTMSDASYNNQNKTSYHGFGYLWQGLLGITTGNESARTDAIDSRLALLCANMKARNIIIYTVRVEVTSGSSSLLQNCASDPSMFYDVQDVSDLGAVFDSIAGSIDNLRITK